MLLPSLRLLVRHQARSVPHRLQRRLVSTDTAPDGFSNFLVWSKKQVKPQSKQSQLRPRNAQGGKSLKEKKAKKIKKSQSYDSTLRNVSNAMTREERIREAVLGTIHKKEALTPAASNWPGENWKTESWGLDSESPVLNLERAEEIYHSETRAELEPPPSDRDPIAGIKKLGDSKKSKPRPSGRRQKSDGEYNRRFEGVLTPLDSPVLQGASSPVYLACLHAYGFYRRGSIE